MQSSSACGRRGRAPPGDAVAESCRRLDVGDGVQGRRRLGRRQQGIGRVRRGAHGLRQSDAANSDSDV